MSAITPQLVSYMKFSQILDEYLELRDEEKYSEFTYWSRCERMTELLAEMDKLIKVIAP